MKNKKFYFLIGGLMVAFLFYSYAHQPLKRVSPRGAAILYNYAVKTNYGQEIKVARVIDGDTIELINGDRLRYIGIDTPEEFDPRKPVQYFAREAAEANKTLVEGKSVVFYKDVSERDKYGRWLGLVYLNDGTFVNRTLVQQGLAFAYPYKPDISHAGEFQQAESQARQAHLGLWSACTVHRTSGGREQTNDL